MHTTGFHATLMLNCSYVRQLKSNLRSFYLRSHDAYLKKEIRV